MINKKTILLFLLSLFIIALPTAFYTFFVIYKEVKSNCLKAQGQYQQDCVNSLTKFIENENNSLKERNSAIWALGQLADKKSLPFLYQLKNSLSDQEKCDHERYLCKYEIGKAIKWCEKGNITSWMYQNRENWVK